MRVAAIHLHAALVLLGAGCGAELTPPCVEAGSSDSSSAGVEDAPGDAADAVVDSDAGKPDVVGVKIHAECAEGNDCEGGVCCAVLTLSSSCVLEEIDTKCSSPQSCSVSLQPLCNGKERVRLCDRSSDCSEPGMDRCCVFPQGPTNTVVMCASLEMAQNAAGAYCL